MEYELLDNRSLQRRYRSYLDRQLSEQFQVLQQIKEIVRNCGLLYELQEASLQADRLLPFLISDDYDNAEVPPLLKEGDQLLVHILHDLDSKALCLQKTLPTLRKRVELYQKKVAPPNMWS